MKVFISVDLEGVTGVFAEDQTTVGTTSYEAAREYMRADLDAVLEGCLSAGATEIVVADGHDRGSNLRSDDLPPEVSLVSGSPAPLSMMEGIDRSFAAAMLVGYHARAGTPGAVLEHTYSYDVHSIRVGDREVGEVGINAGIAGAFGVPVVLVTGDDKLAAEVATVIPAAACTVVKYGAMRTAARLLAPQAARDALRESAARALSLPAEPLDLSGQPMIVTFRRVAACDAASRCPGARRRDGYALELEGGDFPTVFRSLLTCVALAQLSGD
jgi:D-amino peptidase